MHADLDFHVCVLAVCSNELLIPLGTLIERTLEGQLRLNAKRADVYNASLVRHTAVIRCDHRPRCERRPPRNGRLAWRDAGRIES